MLLLLRGGLPWLLGPHPQADSTALGRAYISQTIVKASGTKFLSLLLSLNLWMSPRGLSGCHFNGGWVEKVLHRPRGRGRLAA